MYLSDLTLKYLQQLSDILLSKRYLFSIINNQAGDTHDLILFPKVREVIQVIDLGGDVRIFCGDPLGRRYPLWAHGTGEGDQDL